jgi:hypothetical protein
LFSFNEQNSSENRKQKNKIKWYLRFNSRVIESRRNVSRDVLVTLFVTVVLGDVVKVITTDNEGTLHLGRGDNTSKDTTLDVDFTDERTLLVNVGTGLGFLGGLETVTDFLEPTLVTLLGVLGVLENTSLLLESLLGLF